jgi:hypothetical protein
MKALKSMSNPQLLSRRSSDRNVLEAGEEREARVDIRGATDVMKERLGEWQNAISLFV